MEEFYLGIRNNIILLDNAIKEKSSFHIYRCTKQLMKTIKYYKAINNYGFRSNLLNKDYDYLLSKNLKYDEMEELIDLRMKQFATKKNCTISNVDGYYDIFAEIGYLIYLIKTVINNPLNFSTRKELKKYILNDYKYNAIRLRNVKLRLESDFNALIKELENGNYNVIDDLEKLQFFYKPYNIGNEVEDSNLLSIKDRCRYLNRNGIYEDLNGIKHFIVYDNDNVYHVYENYYTLEICNTERELEYTNEFEVDEYGESKIVKYKSFDRVKITPREKYIAASLEDLKREYLEMYRLCYIYSEDIRNQDKYDAAANKIKSVLSNYGHNKFVVDDITEILKDGVTVELSLNILMKTITKIDLYDELKRYSDKKSKQNYDCMIPVDDEEEIINAITSMDIEKTQEEISIMYKCKKLYQEGKYEVIDGSNYYEVLYNGKVYDVYDSTEERTIKERESSKQMIKK